jgi:hypothetical protein
MRATLSIILLTFAVSGCIHTQEMPLAPNVVRLDTQASGLLFVNQATSATMKRAAEVTIEHGYTHFLLDQGQISQGQQIAGVYTTGQATGSGTATVTGPGTATYSGSAHSSSVSTPLFKRTSSVGVTVIMFKATDPQAEGAFNAAEVLKKGG